MQTAAEQEASAEQEKGLVTVDVRSLYFRLVNNFLIFSDDGSSFGVVWQRIRGSEISIAKDKELSFILENLMKLTGKAGKRFLRSIDRLIDLSWIIDYFALFV